ncbi:MAG TPA: NAD-dependent epimerase/dehydratase family protein [Actinomycetota bacterium]|nr:NAD-dependent epimerase/dehydratase family protein [Actinomycetota bacterium]
MTEEADRAVLVTGAAGFIGSHLCDRLLADGNRVIGLDDLSTGRIANLAEARSYGKRFTFDHADIRDPAVATLFERARPEVVMHLAAQSGVRPSVEDPRRDAEINILGMINILECAAAAGTRKVVFAASGGTLYGEPRRLPVKESARAGAHPLSPYGISKRVAEDYLRYYERYRGVAFTALALGNVYGPRQDPHGEAGVISIFSSKMLAGEAPRINGDGNQTRDYVFVEDVVHAFALAADAGDGKLVNVGTGLETSVNHLYRMLADEIGFEGAPQYGPLPAGDLRRSSLDPSLAGTELGWKPWTQLEEGLSATVKALAPA